MIKQQTTDISRGFSFCLGENMCCERAKKVSLPHTVKLTPANSSGCRNYQGKCIYEKELLVENKAEGEKLWLTFEGAMGTAVLYINGERVAESFCGYIPFVVDVSDVLVEGKNTLRIILDNSDNNEVPPGKPQQDLDFSYDGGLYRKAYLKRGAPLYITEPLLEREVAGGGIFVHYTNVSERAADVHTRVQIKNEYTEAKQAVLVTELCDNNQNTVYSHSADFIIESGEKLYLENTFTVSEPLLWSIDEPNLYNLRFSILLDGEDIGGESLEIGIRSFRFTVEDGVIFNGVSHRFSGVNYHQTWPYIGNAVPESLLLRDMMKLKEMGCENIRSHYPFGRAVTDACNRLGMTLIVSNPGWQFCREGIFTERAVDNMRQIIRWQRNNPSIILWEPVLNESKMDYELQLRFHQTVHEEYPYDDCYTASDFGPTDVSYKDYTPGMIGYPDYGFIEKRDLTPTPIWTREYGDSPDNFHDQNTVWRMPRGFGDAPMVDSVNRMLKRYMRSEEDTVQYIDVCNNKKRCGYGVWPGIEHNRGYHINPCYGGHLDLFRIEKFSYYFMQSQQDREHIGDVLYIASWWCDISPDDVTVFSNAERVELWCDGVLVGSQMPDSVSVKHPPFTYRHVRRDYKAANRSCLTARAFVGDTCVAEVKKTTPGVAEGLRLEADLMGIQPIADGADIFAVRCYVTDGLGQTVPITADRHPILFGVEGEGEIVGDSEIFANPVFPDGGIATVLVRTTDRAGEIKIKAEMYFPQGCGRNIPCSVHGDELILQSKQIKEERK